jgi:tetratricopeptide (TPR) repeat protein
MVEAETLLARGIAALDDGSPSAVGLLQEAFDHGPSNVTGRMAAPWLALAKARFGDLAAGQSTINATPLDCYPCLIVRAQIAEQAGDRGAAARWFAEAIRQGPDLPQAYGARGAFRLRARDIDGAIADARTSARLSPRYPDAPRLWGDALSAKGDWRGAMAHYDRALALAPTWPSLRRAREEAHRHLS